MTRIAPGDVVMLTVSDSRGRVLPPWPYRLDGFEFLVVERKDRGSRGLVRRIETLVTRGRFRPLGCKGGEKRTAVELDAPWPVAVKKSGGAPMRSSKKNARKKGGKS